MSLREAREAVVKRYLRALEDNWQKALPRLLDELDTIDREHIPTGIVPMDGELTEEDLADLKARWEAKKGGPVEVLPPEPRTTRRRTTRKAT